MEGVLAGMVNLIGALVFALGLVAWVGQILSFFMPSIAVRLGVLEPEADVDPTLRIMEARVEGLVEIFLLWTLPAGALLMILEHPFWPYLGLVGGGAFLYFSGLIMLTRVLLKRAGRKVGRRASERAAYLFGSLWVVSALVMIGLSIASLSG
jgi:hypothetical protein